MFRVDTVKCRGIYTNVSIYAHSQTKARPHTNTTHKNSRSHICLKRSAFFQHKWVSVSPWHRPTRMTLTSGSNNCLNSFVTLDIVLSGLTSLFWTSIKTKIMYKNRKERLSLKKIIINKKDEFWIRYFGFLLFLLQFSFEVETNVRLLFYYFFFKSPLWPSKKVDIYPLLTLIGIRSLEVNLVYFEGFCYYIYIIYMLRGYRYRLTYFLLNDISRKTSHWKTTFFLPVLFT